MKEKHYAVTKKSGTLWKVLKEFKGVYFVGPRNDQNGCKRYIDKEIVAYTISVKSWKDDTNKRNS